MYGDRFVAVVVQLFLAVDRRAAARLLAKTFFATPILGTPDSDDESEDETIAEYDGSLLFIY